MGIYLIRAEAVSEFGVVKMANKRNFISVEEFEQELKDYKQLVFKGQMMDFVVAFILGAALNNVAKSISENLIMPVVSFALNSTGQNWEQMSWQPMMGLRLEIGKFLATCISFTLIALILFVIWVGIRHFSDPRRVPIKMRLRKLWRKIFPWKLVRKEDETQPESEKGDVTLNITSPPNKPS